MATLQTRRVVVTGMAGISPIGCDWDTIERNLRAGRNAVRYLPGWEAYDGLNTRLGAPAADFESALPHDLYNRKRTRSMGRIALMACRASELALLDAGLIENRALLTGGRVGVSYGSSAGSPPAIGDFGRMIYEKTTEGVNANSYIKMMSHTTPVNIAVFFGLAGRVITTSSACTSGSQGIGYAFEAIKYGHADVMIAGGAEELCATEAAVFDTLFATSTRNDSPSLTPRPYDANRDGLVIGEGAGTLILEEYEHALARGAVIHAELVGFGTNCDGTHVTQPQSATMAQAMHLALADAGLPATAVGYVNGHGTATEQGDIAETQATHAVFGAAIPISSFKSYVGHTLGACGALEAWWTIEMMKRGWFAPTINLDTVDPRCAPLDYIRGSGRSLDCDVVMSNNFAFGGINTSLVFKKP
ncbi:3-oxoacyl-[acyl-carrier-protein] synthase 2 [Andreprevotia sp. IGB-42]|uniref:beta-ketoacyl-ACP synthase n=1 Tax=Andreprevotia sp. IGB-42 TaxID=2497473 RepID=UPI001358B532|nr:beta-ketoacyl-ACP synthase [Andreprevotia sp. IGB-42]KAF0813794.1 3-oxoacyl-[acyl-carrier-protein] synthase 2 [Andreprevotia sp. IGB-42]